MAGPVIKAGKPIGRIRPYNIGDSADVEAAWSMYHCHAFSCESRGQRACASLPVSAMGALSASVGVLAYAPVLTCCGVVQGQPGGPAP